MFAVSWSATESGSWLWSDLTLGVYSVSIRTQATLLTPPPPSPQIHAPKFNIRLQNLDSTGNTVGREGGTKWEREQEQRYRLSHNLYCPYLQPLPQEVSIWEESSAYNTVDGRLLPGHWALMLLCSPQPPSETTSVLPGLPISSITAHAWSRHGHASPCILPSDLIPVVLSPIPHHPPFLIQIFPYWVSYLPFPSSLSLYNLLSLGKFPRGYWQGF